MSTSLGSEGGGGGGGWDDGTGAAEGQFPDDEPPLKRSRKRTKQVRCSVDMLLGPLAPWERAGVLMTIACPCRARSTHLFRHCDLPCVQGVYTRWVTPNQLERMVKL